MPTSTLTETISRTGYVGGLSEPVTFTDTNSSAPASHIDYLTLSTSLVAVTIPSNTNYIRITGESGNTINILAAGDTNATSNELIPLHPTDPTRLAVPSSSPRLALASASGTPIVRLEFF